MDVGLDASGVAEALPKETVGSAAERLIGDSKRSISGDSANFSFVTRLGGGLIGEGN